MDITYPDLAQVLYTSANLEEAWTRYIIALREQYDVYCSQYASKLEQSKRMLSASKLKQLEKDFSAFKDHMRSWSNRTGIRLSLQRRQKDFVGLNSKIRLYLETGQTLSQIHDLLGFRIVVQTPNKDSIESVQCCYDVLKEAILFFTLQKDSMLLEAEPRSGEEITAKKANELGIIVPSSSGLAIPGLERNVKDYVLHPKSSGYQSLHALIMTKCDLIFEIQVRTSAMDFIAECGACRHSSYKKSKYSGTSLEDIDFTKINMDGFKALPDGEIYDKIGLYKSIDPFNLIR